MFHSLLILLSIVLGVDYCENDPKHILCQEENERISDGCPDDVEFFPASEIDKEEIIKTLNELRREIAIGDPIFDLDPAGNMMEVVWDNELALASEGILRKCNRSYACKDCLVNERGYKLIVANEITSFPSTYSKPLPWKKYINRLLSVAWTEKNLITNTSFFHDVPFIPNDIIIWAEVYMVGCSVSISGEESDTVSIVSVHNIVCVFGPTGPEPGKPMYLSGEPCTMCPLSSQCSNSVVELCKCSDTCYPFKYQAPESRRRKRADAETTTKPPAATTPGSGNGSVAGTAAEGTTTAEAAPTAITEAAETEAISGAPETTAGGDPQSEEGSGEGEATDSGYLSRVFLPLHLLSVVVVAYVFNL